MFAAALQRLECSSLIDRGALRGNAERVVAIDASLALLRVAVANSNRITCGIRLTGGSPIRVSATVVRATSLPYRVQSISLQRLQTPSDAFPATRTKELYARCRAAAAIVCSGKFEPLQHLASLACPDLVTAICGDQVSYRGQSKSLQRLQGPTNPFPVALHKSRL